MSNLFPLATYSIRRLKLTLAEYWLLQCMRDSLDLGMNVSQHDSRALEAANLIREFRNEYYARKS